MEKLTDRGGMVDLWQADDKGEHELVAHGMSPGPPHRKHKRLEFRGFPLEGQTVCACDFCTLKITKEQHATDCQCRHCSPETLQREMQIEAYAKGPRLSVAVAVLDDQGKILLGRRGKDPYHGKWVIPGGGIHFGEHWIDAAHREILEETGLQIKLDEESCIRPLVLEIKSETEHKIVLYVNGFVAGGKLVAGSDLLEVKFFRSWEVPSLDLTPAVRKIFPLVMRR